MKNCVLFLVSCVLCLAAAGAPPVFYRDASGRVAGSAVQNGNRVIYRDAQGRMTGSAVQQGNRVIYRDASGRFAGSATPIGNRTVFGSITTVRVIGTREAHVVNEPFASSRSPARNLTS